MTIFNNLELMSSVRTKINNAIGWLLKPEDYGAVVNGVTDDLAAYQATQTAAATNQTILISGPSVLSGPITESGKYLLRQTTGPIAWPDTLSAQRALPGVVSGNAAVGNAIVFNMKRNTPETGGLMLVSLRTEPSSSAANFQTNAMQVAIVCADPSDPDPGGGEYLIRRGNVALMPRADVAAGNMNGAIWALNPFATVPAGSEGSAIGTEVNVANYASVVTDFGASYPKVGMQIVPYGNALTAGLVLSPGTSDGFVRGFVVRSNAMSATYGKSAFEFEGKWRVDPAGNMYLGKATGLESEEGVALMQAAGTAVFTRSANFGTSKFIRAGTLTTAQTLWNLDGVGYSTAGTQRTFARVQLAASTVTDGAEEGLIRFVISQGGVLVNEVKAGTGLSVGASAVLSGAGTLNTTNGYYTAATRVVSARKTGWAVATGTSTRTTFDTTTVTLPQLAERVKALIDDLHATAGHGLIGT